jgi:hypothetical protein
MLPSAFSRSDRKLDTVEICGGMKCISDFVDDFALVASDSGGTPNVAAACLESGELPSKRFSIRVAKDEEFKPGKVRYLEGIVAAMNRVKKGVDKSMLAQPLGSLFERVAHTSQKLISRPLRVNFLLQSWGTAMFESYEPQDTTSVCCFLRNTIRRQPVFTTHQFHCREGSTMPRLGSLLEFVCHQRTQPL